MQKRRVAIFIDGSNLYHGLKALGIKRIDFQVFAKQLTEDRELKKIFYYTAMIDKSFDEKR